jgi:hypothetical protein
MDRAPITQTGIDRYWLIEPAKETGMDRAPITQKGIDRY